LGADDKAGVAIIMDFARYIAEHPQVQHGTIKIFFTPDEEVGKGTARADLKKLGADFAYTLDGGEAGSFENETFSADAVKIVINGVSTHPGYAKDKMVNALKVAGKNFSRSSRKVKPGNHFRARRFYSSCAYGRQC